MEMFEKQAILKIINVPKEQKHLCTLSLLPWPNSKSLDSNVNSSIFSCIFGMPQTYVSYNALKYYEFIFSVRTM